MGLHSPSREGTKSHFWGRYNPLKKTKKVMLIGKLLKSCSFNTDCGIYKQMVEVFLKVYLI